MIRCSKKAVFLATDSTNESFISGKTSLSAKPGNPAPEPMSITRTGVTAAPASSSPAARHTVSESKEVFDFGIFMPGDGSQVGPLVPVGHLAEIGLELIQLAIGTR